jgi:hypothetical protein
MKTPNTSAPEATLFDVVDIDPTPSTRAERLYAVKEKLGFYPETFRELTEATTLISYPEDPNIVNRHLGEIFVHQDRPTTQTDDPRAAIRSVTQEFAEYAAASRSNVFFATDCRDMLVDKKPLVSPLTSLANVPGLVQPLVEASARGYGQLVRHRDLSCYEDLLNEGVEPLKLRYTSNNPDLATMDRIAAVLTQVRYIDGLKLVESVIKNQRHRQEFWTGQLLAARRHTVAKPVAEAALKKLNVTL